MYLLGFFRETEPTGGGGGGGGMREKEEEGGERGSVDILFYFKKLAHVIMKADIFEICRAADILETQKSVNITA